jgi:peptidoglycan/LPS O-acetylase OafA/YrhL
MEIDAEMRRKIGLSVAVTVGFIALILGIGASFDGRSLGSTGGLALVASIALFVVVMGAVGVVLSRDD